MKILKVFLFLFFVACLNCFGQSQGINNFWNVGYGSYWGAPFGHTNIDFFSGQPITTSDSIQMDIFRAAANIADANGNILFYTNGYYVADASNDTMFNGNYISPTGFRQIEPRGLNLTQACLILPNPTNANKYFLFHNTVDNAPYYNKSLYLYMSEIDMTLNGGLGGVINKNTILIQDTLNPGKITACKHANGRDWWVVVQRVNSNTYYKFNITQTGILGPYTQNIGTIRTNWYGMATFSPDGTKYATFHAEYQSSGGMDIMDFDRCTGNFSNSIHIPVAQCTGISGGLAFSGNSHFLYVANIEKLYQYDVTATNIPTSKITVAQWDSFYSPTPPFATLFEIPQLAPDGKIYIATGNSTFHMHVINYPDSSGLACNVVQHAIQFQSYYINGLPNHPNYFLGCDTTLGCTTCYTSISENVISKNDDVKVFPNPTNGKFTLQFNVQSTPGTAEVYDINGKQVLSEYIAPWSQYKPLDITNLPKGIYLCKLTWGNKETGIKVIKE